MSLKVLAPVCLFSGLSLWCLMAEDAPIPDRRAAAKQQFDAGNFRDAYDVYSKLALHADNAGDPLADEERLHAVRRGDDAPPGGPSVNRASP